MSTLRFNQIFLALLFFSALCAFLVPINFATALRGRLNVIFAPVAYPVRQAAISLTHRLDNEESNAKAASSSELDALQTSVANLTLQLSELKQLYAGRELVGDVSKYSSPFKVIGADAGGKAAILLQGSTTDGLLPGQAVVRRDGVVGRVISASGGGAQVRLITDPGFRVYAAIGTFVTTPDGKRTDFVRRADLTPLVEGVGDGMLAITSLSLKQVAEAKIAEGDWVVLADSEDFPFLLAGYRLGFVEKIEKSSKNPLFAHLTVRPRINLLQLREVMVVTGRTPAPANAGLVEVKGPPANPAAKTSVKH